MSPSLMLELAVLFLVEASEIAWTDEVEANRLEAESERLVARAEEEMSP